MLYIVIIIWDAVHRCFLVATANAYYPKYVCAGTKKAEERAAVVSELLVHALLALCFVMSTMPPIGQLVGVLKCLIKLTFTLGPIGLGPKTRIF